jgi:hypothetical protein
VVFDGAPAGSAGRSRELSGTGVDVVFARAGRTADAIIKERVRAARNPGQVTVVTSDADVARVARLPRDRARFRDAWRAACCASQTTASRCARCRTWRCARRGRRGEALFRKGRDE